MIEKMVVFIIALLWYIEYILFKIKKRGNCITSLPNKPSICIHYSPLANSFRSFDCSGTITSQLRNIIVTAEKTSKPYSVLCLSKNIANL